MTDKPARKPRPLTADRYITWLRRHHSNEEMQHSAVLRKATRSFFERRNVQRCNKLAELSDAERPAAVAMAQALGLGIDTPTGHPQPIGRDVPAMTAEEMRAALDGMPEPHFTVQPKTRVGDPLYVSADEIDDAIGADPMLAAIAAAEEDEATDSERAALDEVLDDAPEERSGKLPDVAGMDEVPARLREPLSASRLAIGKGR